MVYCVGLTGNIASGKTLVTQLFAQYDIDIFNADTVAKALTSQHQPAYQKIVEHFSPIILQANGELNRKALRDIIFSQPKERIWLEELLHPLIRKQLQTDISLSKSPYCLVEIPLLKDKKSYPYLNKILLVNADSETQISRVMRRDQCTKEQALAILAIQPDIQDRIKIADNVIDNNLGINELSHAVKILHHQYLEEAKRLAN